MYVATFDDYVLGLKQSTLLMAYLRAPIGTRSE
jgi:hypothetical protein